MMDRQETEETGILIETIPEGLYALSDLDNWEFEEGAPDIRGWNVVDRDGNSIGAIDDLIVDAPTGQVVFSIVGHGGFLDMGEEKTAIPVDLLDIDEENKKVIFLGEADEVKNAPRYTDQTRDWDMQYDYWQMEDET